MVVVVKRVGQLENERALRIAILADAGHVNCQRWCEGLRIAGADIHIISFRGFVSGDMPVYQLPIRSLPGKLHYFAAVPYLRRLLATIKPDVLLAYYITGYGTLGALAGFHPLVQVTSGSDVLLAPRNPIMKLLLRYTLSRSDLVTAWASHMALAAQQLGVPQERMLVLPRGIPYQQFANNRSLPPGNSGSVSIISTRSLKSNYNIDRLLKAVSLLHHNGTACSVTLVGDGPCRDRLVACAKQLGITNQVRFAGFVPNDQLSALLARHNLYISLIDSDGVSASLLEAMTVGLLPIVPNHPANRFWIRNGENGLLLNDLSPDAIAQGIHQAISDLPLRRRAWLDNSEIVRQHADLCRNSEIFLQTFSKLARSHRACKVTQVSRPTFTDSPPL